jgi:hypothetical protein
MERFGEKICSGAKKGKMMSNSRSNHWDAIKEQGFVPLCGDWNADGSGELCEIFIDAGYGAVADCISCRKAYRKDEEGNIEYFR